MLLTRAGRLPLSSFLCFVGGFSMGSWLTMFHQLQSQTSGIEPLPEWDPPGHLPEPLLTVLIISSPENFKRRNTIRDTWLRLDTSKSVKHVFAVGDQNLSPSLAYSLVTEGNKYSDLLLLPIADSYSNLTLKVLSAIVAISKERPSFVLKVDDDSFARVDVLASELSDELRNSAQRRTKSRCYYWGFFDGRARPKKSGKWKETEYDLCDTYIPYALGGGYVLSRDCVEFLARNEMVLRRFQNEDISVGTWLSGVNTYRRHDRRFDTEFESRGCSDAYIVQHKISEKEMEERYANLVRNNRLCLSEFRKRASFEYDWTVPPSQCCKRNFSIF